MWPLDTKKKINKAVKKFCRSEGVDVAVYKKISKAVDEDTVYKLLFGELQILMDVMWYDDFLENDRFGFAFYEYVFAFAMINAEFIKEKTGHVLPLRPLKPKAKVLPFAKRK